MSIGTLIAILLVLAAIVTVIPRPTALRKSMLGYRSLCTFAPISTSVLLITAFIAWILSSLP
jgi:hypothetical protein